MRNLETVLQAAAPREEGSMRLSGFVGGGIGTGIAIAGGVGFGLHQAFDTDTDRDTDPALLSFECYLRKRKNLVQRLQSG